MEEGELEIVDDGDYHNGEYAPVNRLPRLAEEQRSQMIAEKIQFLVHYGVGSDVGAKQARQESLDGGDKALNVVQVGQAF